MFCLLSHQEEQKTLKAELAALRGQVLALTDASKQQAGCPAEGVVSEQ